MPTEFSETSNLRKKYDQIFREAYHRLNENQRAAVDIIDGPVMVIAGPGTGKTQILATRIGKILQETDAAPHNILCLTYTDAATISMRSRLVEMIGPDAHKIHIQTFHAFCNQVIQENLGLFGNYRQLEPITELERVDIFTEILRNLPDDHRLKRLKGDPQYEKTRLQNLFSLMKKENYDLSNISEAVENYYQEVKEDPKMYYQRKGRGFSKGDFKEKELLKIQHRMDDLLAGAELLVQYQNAMMEKGRYDYDDMIIWVLREFESGSDLLAHYQERYQYFLVDEFQDTNGAQRKLLDLLISFWEENPNVFVVGDDDQAIYKFQGANMGNIKAFRRKYLPTLIVLDKNYRSSQVILDAAQGLIEFNEERIVKDLEFGLNKNLVALSDHRLSDRQVRIKAYPNIVQEQAGIVSEIVQKFRNGEDLSQIAILYRNHRQVEKMVEVLEKKKIPLNIRKPVNILKMPLVRNILNILSYINAQYLNQGFTDKVLFEIMHYNFFGIKPHDVSKLIWHTRVLYDYDPHEENTKTTPLRSLIGNKESLAELQLSSEKEICSLHELIDKWISDVNDVTLQVLFQNVLNEGHILNYILSHTDKSWLLQVLGTLFDLIKEETNKQPGLSLNAFLEMIEKMTNNKIPLAINKVLSAERGVHFLTAHSSKGLEFEQVHILGATKDVWDSTRGSNSYFSYPPLISGKNDANIEDERRLMFVGMTRAEKYLDISFSLSKEDGKVLGASQFIDEIVSTTSIGIIPIEVGEDTINEYQYNVLLKQNKDVALIDHDLIDRMLEGYKLSVTGLNKYMQCPLTFYFEAVLKVPMARTKYLGFGRAIHYALEYFHIELNDKKNPDKKRLLYYFNLGMAQHKSHFTKQEFRDMSIYGEQVLDQYFEDKLKEQEEKAIKYHLEVKIDHAEFQGIPIKGVLDRVALLDKQEVVITDFKTGNAYSSYTKPKLSMPTEKKPEGGDYWRQIVFYKILLNSDRKNNWDMTTGIMDFVEPDRRTGIFFSQKYIVSDDDIKIVGEQIKKTWASIHAHEFERGCGEDDCQWCEFVQNDYVLDPQLKEEDWELLD